MGRAPCCDKANVKKGPWSPEEDAKLKSYIEKHGTGGNWIALPQKIGLKRCGKSCRLRWLNYLRPNIKHGGFTEDEDNLICSLYVSIGSRWSIIAAQLPGRTDNDIKNYWNTRLKKKLLGKQRREQQARRGSGGAKQLGTGSYSIKESLSLYPRPQQPAAPPLLVGYASEENRLHGAASDSLESNPAMPQFEVKFSCDHTQLDHQEKIFESFHCFSDQNQQVCKNSTCTSFMNCSRPPSGVTDVHINVPAFDSIPEEGIYGSMPQLLDGVDSYSAIDIVNSSTISSSSLENTSWEDTSSIVYPQSALTDYDICHQEMLQYWTLFDEPRLPGYSK